MADNNVNNTTNMKETIIFSTLPVELPLPVNDFTQIEDECVSPLNAAGNALISDKEITTNLLSNVNDQQSADAMEIINNSTSGKYFHYLIKVLVMTFPFRSRNPNVCEQ